jgi:hypothetical protein
MKHREHVKYRARGTAGHGKLPLIAIQFIERLYVLRSARDSENCCTNDPIRSSKVRSSHIEWESAGKEHVAAYVSRGH